MILIAVLAFGWPLLISYSMRDRQAKCESIVSGDKIVLSAGDVAILANDGNGMVRRGIEHPERR